MTKSASFSMPVTKGYIKRVAVGRKPIAEIFTREQQEFLSATAGHAIDFAGLAVLGPLVAQRWQFEDPGCPWPITAELWKREDGDLLLEVSIKAPVKQAAAATAGFMAFLAEMGAERDRNEQAKTRWALEYYAGKLARERPAARPAREAAKRPAGSPLAKPLTGVPGGVEPHASQ